ncbi:hypothetical protein ABT143_10585, partial [Streptomyces sp. NPDC002033]
LDFSSQLVNTNIGHQHPKGPPSPTPPAFPGPPAPGPLRGPVSAVRAACPPDAPSLLSAQAGAIRTRTHLCD